MSLSVVPILYGPTPLHDDQGEEAYFTFQVVASAGSSYASLTAGVQLFDGNGNVVRTLRTSVTLGPGGSATVSLAWDGKDDSGNPLPPGDYAPTFTATGTF